jgi:hypothetical protein
MTMSAGPALCLAPERDFESKIITRPDERAATLTVNASVPRLLRSPTRFKKPVLRIRTRDRPRRPDQANLIEQDAEATGFRVRL